MKSAFLSLGLAAAALIATGCRSSGPKFDPRAPGTASGYTTNKFGQLVPLDNSSFTPIKPGNGLDPAWLKPATNLYLLGPGDTILTGIVGETNSYSTTTVGPDGKIYFSLLPGTLVWGLNLPQTKNLIEQQMAKYFAGKVEAEVALRSVQSKQVWILGSVQAPGVYPMSSPVTVLGAISMARGLSSLQGSTEDRADLRNSFVMRKGQVLPLDMEGLLRRGDLSQNIYLEPDDFLYFPAAAVKTIRVIGAVLQPVSYPYSSGASLVQAVLSAGGTLPYAYLSKVAIIRGSLSSPAIATANYAEITRGEQPDIALEPGDIVYVSFRPLMEVQKLGEQIVNQLVRTIAVNEGRNAVQKNAPVLNLSVPLAN